MLRIVTLTLAAGLLSSSLVGGPPAHADSRTAGSAAGLAAPAPWRTKVLPRLHRVRVLDATGTSLATFTPGSRTVTLRGPSRTFRESTTTATVTTSTWVRLLPKPFDGTVPQTWLSQELADTSPDVLAVALQYVTGAPTVLDATGARVSDDAHYGPLQADGTRAEGSDFNDYLGLPWRYGTYTDAPETDQADSLDCSGFLRMVLGYRSGFPLSLDPDGVSLPRRSVQMATSGPGVTVIANTGAVPTSTQAATLAPGDLVFFDGSTDDGTAIDHAGIYLGKDSTGAMRFVSSRKTADGPTMGDFGGRSTLTGTGHYALSWRSARRV